MSLADVTVCVTVTVMSRRHGVTICLNESSQASEAFVIVLAQPQRLEGWHFKFPFSLELERLRLSASHSSNMAIHSKCNAEQTRLPRDYGLVYHTWPPLGSLSSESTVLKDALISVPTKLW